MTSIRTRTVPRLPLLALTAAGLLAAGCGGSSSSAGAGDDANAGAPAAAIPGGNVSAGRATSTTAAPSVAPKGTVKSNDPITRSHKPAQARDVGGKDAETAAPTKTATDPCTLVTRAQARAIVGRSIERVTSAPQGPTCIYQAKGAKQPVTLAVQTLDLAGVRKQSRELARIRVAGHVAYCVKYGSVMTYVPLSGGRVLNVTAPCQMAANFAARALARIG